MYKILSSLSYIVRFYFAYLTIENVSIFKNEVVNYFWVEVISIYSILMIISYFITGLFYDKNSDFSWIGVIIYFFVYCILLCIYWLLLLLLTWFNILPIVV